MIQHITIHTFVHTVDIKHKISYNVYYTDIMVYNLCKHNTLNMHIVHNRTGLCKTTRYVFMYRY